MTYEPRLIEGRFPCNEVGAETKRERGASSSLPPLYFLHVWWARRPLTPSRAAVLGSILPANTDPEVFLRDLGIVKKQAVIGDQRWTLVGKNLELVQTLEDGTEALAWSVKVQKALDKEIERRKLVRDKLNALIQADASLATDLVVTRWLAENGAISNIEIMQVLAQGNVIPVVTVTADPAHINERITFAASDFVFEQLGERIQIDPEDLYAYGRAYETPIKPVFQDITVLDPTAGGGSIPFEAARLGCKVIANDLNPVATTIEAATLKYPIQYGSSLIDDIEKYGQQLCKTVESEMAPFYHFEKGEVDQTGLLYHRTVTCPACGERAPLLNAFALSKKSDGWMVIPKIEGYTGHKKVRLIPTRLRGGKGPNGEDPEQGSVVLGTGTCLFCHQAIPSDEIKRQAQAGQMTDDLYIVAAVRNVQATGKDGKMRIIKETFYREPTEEDYSALQRAKEELDAKWSHFEALDLIPTEKIPWGNDPRPIIYGSIYWYQMFTPRQLLGHLTAMETLRNMIPQVLAEHGKDRGTAIITYLQYMIDKCLDYNSRQTRWEYTRSVVKGTFGRHDFSFKWTFGEMVFTGNHSGLDWGKDQVVDAYSGMCKLLADNNIPVPTVLNGSAANLNIESGSVDLIIWDPPYYNNVQYAELSDYFYIWQKRTFRNLYPGVFSRVVTNKEDEAVANPVRDDGESNAKTSYENRMREIFEECARVMKDDGVMTMMFTHKKQEAWETLTRALIESGWIISSTFPVDSESAASMHQKDMAAAASSIFLACRKRNQSSREPAAWQGFGGSGVVHQVRQAVREGLRSYDSLHLNPVDEMVASYGCALRVLSENWPVRDGDELVSPIKAMREASTVVAQYQMERLTDGRISASDLEAEAGIVLTMLGVYGLSKFPYDDALTLSKSLNVRLDNIGLHGYKPDGHMLGIGDDKKDDEAGRVQSYAPVVKKGSILRIALPEERQQKRLDEPKTEWDVLQGMICAYRDGDIPVARAYLQRHASGSEEKILALLRVWADNCGSVSLEKEAQRMLFGLK